MDEGVPGTVLLGASYYLGGARPHPLFRSLPEVIHLPARIGAAGTVRTVVELLGAEMDSGRPGVSAAVPALLDLLLLYTMRTWLETTAQPIGWAQALRDPALSAALRAIQERPAEPWTWPHSRARRRCHAPRSLAASPHRPASPRSRI